MRSRLTVIIAAMLLTILACEARIAMAAESGRLAAFTARQGIRDEICVAMANGYISRGDRYAILSHAKSILKPEEYEGLKRSLDRLSPPKPSPVKAATTVASASTTVAKPATTVARAPATVARASSTTTVQPAAKAKVEPKKEPMPAIPEPPVPDEPSMQPKVTSTTFLTQPNRVVWEAEMR